MSQEDFPSRLGSLAYVPTEVLYPAEPESAGNDLSWSPTQEQARYSDDGDSPGI
ncbi:uncharacterized protein EV420DRAFT_1640929 [Desarmillaria tabescens]|uniref:Uncharacterized protein n=1 Tax=Armillaria tabescens TaxID=1929756 RepID=A0AA39N6V0_ARMTA|nr:uncharacterized protein EV420DRAFT_1640929 [Desarmillaria tabescens]KAK0460381.1 hypothetical protein EV420DRAFT_1640929 [Desarmillaria tabescens]